MKINGSWDITEEILDELTERILERIEQQTQWSTIHELPPCPNRKQVKQQLKIGDHRLNQWIANGLKVIPFGKEARFDRGDIQAFLSGLKK